MYIQLYIYIYVYMCICASLSSLFYYCFLKLFLVNYTVPSGYNYDVSLNVIREVKVLAASQYFSFNVSIALPKNPPTD